MGSRWDKEYMEVGKIFISLETEIERLEAEVKSQWSQIERLHSQIERRDIEIASLYKKIEAQKNDNDSL